MRTSFSACKELLSLLPTTVTIIGLATLSAVLDNATFILFTPALVNVSLLTTFGITLRDGATPFIERFARLQVDDLCLCHSAPESPRFATDYQRSSSAALRIIRSTIGCNSDYDTLSLAGSYEEPNPG
ncbi:MAG: hypothetical protein GY811_30670 [Myxococcales bacterium]|nr:hypothetical protein [Myxococcales bacterium]